MNSSSMQVLYMNVHVNLSTDSDTHHTRHIILLNKGPSSWEGMHVHTVYRVCTECVELVCQACEVLAVLEVSEDARQSSSDAEGLLS